MKLKIAVTTAVWLLLISLAHVGLNVGFGGFARHLRVMLGEERQELVVGFLPVT